MFGPEMAIMREQTLDAIRSLEQQRNNLDPGGLPAQARTPRAHTRYCIGRPGRPYPFRIHQTRYPAAGNSGPGTIPDGICGQPRTGRLGILRLLRNATKRNKNTTNSYFHSFIIDRVSAKCGTITTQNLYKMS